MTRADDPKDPEATQRIPGLAKAIETMRDAPHVTAPYRSRADRRARALAAARKLGRRSS